MREIGLMHESLKSVNYVQQVKELVMVLQGQQTMEVLLIRF